MPLPSRFQDEHTEQSGRLHIKTEKIQHISNFECIFNRNFTVFLYF